VTGSMGTPARAYSFCVQSDSAQKCGGVQRKIRPNRIQASVGAFARRGGPADHRREGASGAADDDVLRRRALEPHRVDDGVEEDRERQQAAASGVAASAISMTESADMMRPNDSASVGAMRPAGTGA
jgi:hypothetical protein